VLERYWIEESNYPPRKLIWAVIFHKISKEVIMMHYWNKIVHNFINLLNYLA
jgi:hypothetical protein